MATIVQVANSIPGAFRFTRVTWGPMANLDNGDNFGILPGYDRSVQFTGTFGTGGTVVLEGSNEATPSNWFTLRDPQGNSLSFTAVGLKQVLEWTLWVRPRVTGGDGTTAITCNMIVGR
jgi:hypothetical protein